MLPTVLSISQPVADRNVSTCRMPPMPPRSSQPMPPTTPAATNAKDRRRASAMKAGARAIGQSLANTASAATTPPRFGRRFRKRANPQTERATGRYHILTYLKTSRGTPSQR
jgi:hypothetical protein